MRASSVDWSAMGWVLMRWGLAGVFIYAGVAKLQDAAGFAASIERFRIAPLFLVNPAALSLPPLEIFCGCALLVGRWKRSAGFAVAVMSVVFLGALVSAAVRGISVDCHCFGSAESEPLWRTIVRDGLLVAAALATYFQLLRAAAPQARKFRPRASQSSPFFLSFS